jgi:hypothetical protein
MDAMLRLAEAGIREIMRAQEEAIKQLTTDH